MWISEPRIIKTTLNSIILQITYERKKGKTQYIFYINGKHRSFQVRWGTPYPNSFTTFWAKFGSEVDSRGSFRSTMVPNSVTSPYNYSENSRNKIYWHPKCKIIEKNSS